MPRFAANLTLLFNEVPFMDRFRAAAREGFTGVEYLFPYDYDKDELAEALRLNGLQQVLHNLPAGNWAKGERGIGCHPDRVGEFQDGVAPERLRTTLVANLKFAALKLKEHGIKLLIEPINTRRDMPGFYLASTAQALDIIREVGSDNLFVQYDIYHMQVMEGDLAATIEQNLASIAHMQVADNPGRHEPGTGEINYPFLFSHIDRIGYAGWIGCEYKPSRTTAEGLGWVRPHLKTRSA